MKKWININKIVCETEQRKLFGIQTNDQCESSPGWPGISEVGD